jgi:hypothetical protein
MEAKLIKTDKDNYILVDSTKGVYDEGYLLGTSKESDVSKLSLKNCEAIANGYDLDELALYAYEPETSVKHSAMYKYLAMRFFKEGFQKALELNNTKIYTLEDMMNCWNKALTFQNHKELFGYHIQSLQQTEWDVEIERENIIHLKNRRGGLTNMGKPKLDADGCLILKRR